MGYSQTNIPSNYSAGYSGCQARRKNLVKRHCEGLAETGKMLLHLDQHPAGQSSEVHEAGAVRQPLFLLKLLIRAGVARLLPGVQRRLGGGASFLPYYSNRLLTSPL